MVINGSLRRSHRRRSGYSWMGRVDICRHSAILPFSSNRNTAATRRSLPSRDLLRAMFTMTGLTGWEQLATCLTAVGHRCHLPDMGAAPCEGVGLSTFALVG